MIEFLGVNKTYKGGTQALRDVCMKVDKGEFVFIVGPSGAGKSTLMKVMLREEKIDSGAVMVNGVNLTRIKRRHIPQYRRSLGVVFQDFRLIPNLNVYENVAFALRVTNVVSREIRTRVPYVLKLLGLASKAKNMPHQLSGGEQQRVALARALVNNPSIIIADEPTGNIDPELSFEIVDLLTEINEQAGTTIVMVTHEHELVSYFNKRVIVIEDGAVVSDSKNDRASQLFTGDAVGQFDRGASRQAAIDFSGSSATELMKEYDRPSEVYKLDGKPGVAWGKKA